MSQHDFDVTTGDANTGIAFRAALNAAIQALASNNSGAGDPAITYPYQFKVDTGSTPKVFYMRKGDNTAWTRLGYIDSNGRLILDRVITYVVGPYTALLSDDIIIGEGTFTITLSLISNLSGSAFSKEYTIINNGIGIITVDGNGDEKIGEQMAVALKPAESLTIVANGGTMWKRLDNNYSLRFEDIFPDFVLSGLLGTDPGASLTMATPQGTAYVSGRRIVKQTGDADLTYTYPVSQDTYDYLRVDGAIVHQSVANGAGEPSQPSSTIKLQKVVTNATEITGVTDMRPLVGMAATQTPAANKIPVANSSGKLDAWVASAIRDQSRGLVVTNSDTAQPNYQVRVGADELVLQNSTDNSSYKVFLVNLTADITVAGAGGLDTGGEAADAWYYIWIIHNGTTVNILLSTSYTIPTMPSGYIYKALVGAIYNKADANFISIYQQGNKVSCDTFQSLGGGNNTAWTTSTPRVPNNAKRVSGYCGFATTTTKRWIQIAANTVPLSMVQVQGYDVDAGGVTAPFECNIIIPNTLYYRVSDATSSNGMIFITGWEY